MILRQSLIDILSIYPGPTGAEARRWRNVPIAMGSLALLVEGILVYMLGNG